MLKYICRIIPTGKTENSVKNWAVMLHFPLKGGECYGICVHNDIFNHFNCISIIHKKITRPVKAVLF